MNNATLAFLCCSALLTACDNSGDTSSKEEASSLASDAVGSAVDSAQESAVAAVDSAKESVSSAVEKVVETSKEVSSSVVETSTAIVASAPVDNKEGEAVYKKSCNACHGAGVAGSPKLGDKAAWSARLAQGNAVLTEHAIKGFKGDSGYMPPKGGFMSLSDDQVSAAVRYMVSKAE